MPAPGAGEVRLRVKAIGLNRAEIMVREGKYVMPTGKVPSTLGFEASGIVASCWRGRRSFLEWQDAEFHADVCTGSL